MVSKRVSARRWSGVVDSANTPPLSADSTDDGSEGATERAASVIASVSIAI